MSHYPTLREALAEAKATHRALGAARPTPVLPTVCQPRPAPPSPNANAPQR